MVLTFACASVEMAHSTTMQDRSWITKLGDPRLDWRTLQAFLDVAECGTFRSASFKRRFALNTLRGHVGELERMTGQTLMVRSGGGVGLTAAGEDLLRIVRAMAEAKEKAVAVILETGDGAAKI